MRDQHDPESHRRGTLAVVATTSACVVLLIAGFIHVAWYGGGQWLEQVYSSAFYMKFNTTLALICAAAGLIGAAHGAPRIALAGGLGALAVAVPTVSQYITGVSIGIDQLFRHDIHHPDIPYPGRISPGTCIALSCAGLQLILTALNRRKHDAVSTAAELLAFLVFATGAAGILGYLEGKSVAYSWGSYTRMSPHTAGSFVVLGIGLMASAWANTGERVARIPLWAPALLCFVVLMIDISTPRGVATGIAYIPLVFCGLWYNRPYATMMFAVVGSVLSALALFAKAPSETPFWMVIANRVITIAAIWFVAALVSMLRTAEAGLRQGEMRLRAMVDNMVDGLITIDERGIIEQFNAAGERIFGYRADEVVGRNVKILMPEPYHSAHDGYLSHFARTGDARIIGTAGRELTAQRKDGTLLPIDLSICEFTLGNRRHFSGTVRDITERKEAQAALLRYTRELERSNQELDDFAYIASHDLKEPLRGLFNNAQFLQEDYGDKLDEEGRGRLRRLGYLTQRLERLVNDLLYFSRLGRQELAQQVTDIGEIVDDITFRLESLLKEQNATIVKSTPLPQITCDKTRVSEVFHNLAINAVKYNDNAEKRVEVGYLETFEAAHGTERNVFFVRDNGIGIDPQFHSEIFRIFKRLNEEDDQKKGTGVGLTFVRKIIERHGGRIWVESEPGKGACFYFTLHK